MNYGVLAAKNVGRNKLRIVLTCLGVAIALLAFLVIRTVLWAWGAGAEYAAKDRIGTRHKVTFIMPLPYKYIEQVRNDDKLKALGVKQTTWANWFGGKDPKHKKEFFATLAVDPKTFFQVYDEMVLEPAELDSFLGDKQGAIIGDVLARKLGLKVGDEIVLESTIFPGDWKFHISGIYEATRKSIDRSQFLFRWDYFNSHEGNFDKDKIGWIISRVEDPKQSAAVSKRIDSMFEDGEAQTLTMSERNMQLSFMAMFSAILTALDIVSIVILVIMMLILGNTIAMGVRERTSEYGTLRAIGFLPRHIFSMILGEGLVVSILGGALGIGLAMFFISGGMGPWIEENMGGIFPYFRVTPANAAIAALLALLLGTVASLIPAWQASKVPVTEALRRVG